MGSIPHLAQWVRDPVLPQLWLSSLLQLVSDPWPGSPHTLQGGQKKKKIVSRINGYKRIIWKLREGSCVTAGSKVPLYEIQKPLYAPHRFSDVENAWRQILWPWCNRNLPGAGEKSFESLFYILLGVCEFVTMTLCNFRQGLKDTSMILIINR